MANEFVVTTNYADGQPVPSVGSNGIKTNLEALDLAVQEHYKGIDQVHRSVLVGSPQTVQISGGAITIQLISGIQHSFYQIQAETGSADELTTITLSGVYAPCLLILKAYSGHTITIKHGTGNIFTAIDYDDELSGDTHLMFIAYDSNAYGQ